MEDKGFDNPQFLTGFISREQMLQRIQEVPLEEDIPFDFLIRTSQIYHPKIYHPKGVIYLTPSEETAKKD